jgi:hypothetical protein
MEFRQSSQYSRELADILSSYAAIEFQLAQQILSELDQMESHLSSFPEASPLTSEPPIRKYILRRFPLRIRYAVWKSSILLLTIEHMKQDRFL